MPKSLTRIVASILVPCLMCEPARAFAAVFFHGPSQANRCIRFNPLTDQALGFEGAATYPGNAIDSTGAIAAAHIPGRPEEDVIIELGPVRRKDDPKLNHSPHGGDRTYLPSDSVAVEPLRLTVTAESAKLPPITTVPVRSSGVQPAQTSEEAAMAFYHKLLAGGVKGSIFEKQPSAQPRNTPQGVVYALNAGQQEMRIIFILTSNREMEVYVSMNGRSVGDTEHIDYTEYQSDLNGIINRLLSNYNQGRNPENSFPGYDWARGQYFPRKVTINSEPYNEETHGTYIHGMGLIPTSWIGTHYQNIPDNWLSFPRQLWWGGFVGPVWEQLLLRSALLFASIENTVALLSGPSTPEPGDGIAMPDPGLSSSNERIQAAFAAEHAESMFMGASKIPVEPDMNLNSQRHRFAALYASNFWIPDAAVAIPFTLSLLAWTVHAAALVFHHPGAWNNYLASVGFLPAALPWLLTTTLHVGRNTGAILIGWLGEKFGKESWTHIGLGMVPGSVRPLVRILIADDEADERELMKNLVESLPQNFAVDRVEVVMAADRQEALDAYRKAPSEYDLIIADNHMPTMDGFELASAIAKEEEGLKKKIPVYLVTSVMDGNQLPGLLNLQPRFSAALNKNRLHLRWRRGTSRRNFIGTIAKLVGLSLRDTLIERNLTQKAA